MAILEKSTVKLKKVFFNIIIFCLMVAALTVFGASIFTTITYEMHVDVDFPHYVRENIPLLLVSLIFVFAVFLFLKSKDVFTSKKMIGFALVFCMAYCLMLILVIKPQPVNDSKTLDDIINAFMAGDYSSLTEKGGYLFIWPFQLGYVYFGQLVCSIFGTGNYLAWDILQLVSILITVDLIYKMTWEMFEDREICGIMALMSAGCLFFYNYVTYIYGDILSMAPQTLALYFMILYMKRDKVRYGLLSGIFIAIAVMLKTNCEIAVIALVLMILLHTVREHKLANTVGRDVKRTIVIIAAMLVMVFGIKTAVNTHYCALTGLEEIPEGSPSVSHIAMGLQESELEDGWYNGYNYRVFDENDYDTDKTKEAAIIEIKRRLALFTEHPLYGGRFLARKFLTQWADPVCISTHNLDLVSRHVENQPAFCESLVFGKTNSILRWIMNVFMTFCYFGIVVYLFNVLKKGDVSDSEMLMLILIFGGIVFHEFWEGSSRYAMRYYIYWLPFAAFGIRGALNVISGKLKR